ncbi:MAG: hypothetical protein QXG32_00595 [Candidatus Bathyarchaeia archaeon]
MAKRKGKRKGRSGKKGKKGKGRRKTRKSKVEGECREASIESAAESSAIAQ